MRSNPFGLVALVALSASACTENVDSTDVKTSGVYAEMSVLAQGNGSSEVSAGLKVGGSNSNTYLEMKGPDSLSATVGTSTKTLSKSGNFYKTTFPVDAADTSFVVAFNRGPDDESAPNSTVTLPAPFTIAGIATGASISRAAGFTATWQAETPADPMRWTLDGDCMFSANKSISDTGTVTIVAADFSMHSGEEQTTCAATFCVDRTRTGTIDSAFGEGGSIDSSQHRCVAFSSTP